MLRLVRTSREIKYSSVGRLLFTPTVIRVNLHSNRSILEQTQNENFVKNLKNLRNLKHRNNLSKEKESDKHQDSQLRQGKKLLVIAFLAISTSILSFSQQKENPIEFIEDPNHNTNQMTSANSEIKKSAFTSEQVSVIFVLGGPGAGKGTQCDKLVKEYKFVHLSAGDLLRAEQNREGSEYGSLIKHYITEGLIVPQEITINLLKNAITENYKNGKTKFLVDGFPRKMDQAITFEEVIVPSKFTLFFDCPEDVMQKRLVERGKTSGRDDDNLESIKKRFRTFVETSMPVVEYFEKQNKVVKIRCDLPVDEVYANVKKSIDNRF